MELNDLTEIGVLLRSCLEEALVRSEQEEEKRWSEEEVRKDMAAKFEGSSDSSKGRSDDQTFHFNLNSK